MSRQALLVSSLFFILILPRWSAAQGSYLSRGESGLGVEAGYIFNDEVKGGRAAVGLSISGVYDLRLSIGKLSLEEKMNGRDVSAWAFSPRITFHVLKEDTPTMPVSLAASAAYEANSYSSETLDQLGWTRDANSYSLGIYLYRNLSISSSAYLQPRLILAHVMGRSILDQGYGWIQTREDNRTVYGVEASLRVNTQQNANFIVTPGVLIDDDNTTISIWAGLIIPFRR